MLRALVALRCCRGAQHPLVGSQCFAQAKLTSWPQLIHSAPSKLLNSSGQVLQAFFWEVPNRPPFSQTFSASVSPLGAKVGETEGWTWRWTRDGYGGKPPALFGVGEALPLSLSTLGGEMHSCRVGSVQRKVCKTASCSVAFLAHGRGCQTFLPAPGAPQPPHRHAVHCSVLYGPAKPAGTAAGTGEHSSVPSSAGQETWDIPAAELQHLPRSEASLIPP